MEDKMTKAKTCPHNNIRRCSDCLYIARKQSVRKYRESSKYLEYLAKNKEHRKNKARAHYLSVREDWLPTLREIRKTDPRIRARERVKGWRRQGIVFPIGVTLSTLWDIQNGKCGICLKSLNLSRIRQTSVDHDHSIQDGSPNVRALLCPRCNSGLGQFGDSTENLLSAVEYLRKHGK